METLVEQPSKEKLRSFNPLASIEMMQSDLSNYGYVLTETKSRVYDEELSLLAEGINRASKTSFELKRESDELVYFDRGEWRPYTGMLLVGIEVAKQEAETDPRREFLVEKATVDLKNGYQMRGLKPGQKLFWYSSYPHHEEKLYGEKFIKECGFKPERKMGFIYSATCKADGNVVLESQTVDRSDQEAFESAMATATFDNEADLDTITRAYDGALTLRTGKRHSAGRLGAEVEENAWQEIIKQRDLVEFLIHGIETLAESHYPRIKLEKAAEAHIYGVWAAFRNRIESKGAATNTAIQPIRQNPGHAMPIADSLAREVRLAYVTFKSRGEQLTACGGSIGGRSESVQSGEAVFGSIFGEKRSDEQGESYSFDKKMFCVSCQAPPSEDEKKHNAKKMCGPCGLCRTCDKKFGGKG